MAEKWVKMSLPDHGVKRKVADNVETYQNMKFQPKLIQRSREKGQKPQKPQNYVLNSGMYAYNTAK